MMGYRNTEIPEKVKAMEKENQKDVCNPSGNRKLSRSELFPPSKPGKRQLATFFACKKWISTTWDPFAI
jgi:hypothetical protein